MSELVDMHLEGTLCQVCGCLMDDLIPEEGEKLLPSPGHPRSCEDCS